MKKRFSVFIYILIFVLPILASSIRAEVTIYPAPKDVPLSSSWAVRINGRSVPIYSFRGREVSFAVCDIKGRITVSVQPKFKADKITVHPLSRDIKASRKGDEWVFETDRPDSLTVAPDGNCMKDPLHLFLSPPAEKPPKDAVMFGPGKHIRKEPIKLKSGQTLYLAGGAWVEGHIQAFKADNIKIMGRGVLYAPERMKHGIQFGRCKNALIEGIVQVRATKGWCTVFTLCSKINVRYYRAIGLAEHSTDGLNPCNSQDVTVEDCFFRTNDDCIAIKGNSGGTVLKKLPIDPKTQPPVENIVVRRSILWSTYNNAVCIGAETRAKHFKNIRFEDCDVLYHRKYWRDFGTFSILPLHGTIIEDITFDNIRIEYTEAKLFCFKFGEFLYGKAIPGDHSYPGGIRNILIRNIQVLHQAGGIRSEFSGFSPEKRIENVKIVNLRYGDKAVHSKKEMGLAVNQHVSGVTVSTGQAKKSGKK